MMAYLRSTTPAQTYALSTDKTTASEGDSFTITLTTTNIDSGTLVPYEITGVNSEDIGNLALTGNFEVGVTESLNVTLTEDQLTEGTETFQISLSQNSEVTATVAITDSSTAPNLPSYTLNRNAENFHKNVRILDSASPEAVRGVIDVNQHHSLLFVIDEFDVRLHEKITKITNFNYKI